MNYKYKKITDFGFKELVEKVKENLQKQGFGVLTEINVKETLKNKLGVYHEEYVIIGACNPPFAYEALQTETDVGLLLPCNIVVYKSGDKTIVSIANPIKAMSIVQNLRLKPIANRVNKKLKEVIKMV